jgi:hypothetical protein
MGALTAPRNTPQQAGEIFGFPVKAGVVCYQGGLAVLDAGFVKPGVAATGLIAVGRFETTVDNSAGASGDVRVEVRRGIFQFANDTGTPITPAKAGTDAYVLDDQTVTAATTGSRAGKIVAVEAGGVWVQIGLGV